MKNDIQIDDRIRAVLLNDLGLHANSKDNISTLKWYLDVDSNLNEEIINIYINKVAKKEMGIKFLISEIFSVRILNLNHYFQKYLYPGREEE